MPHPLLALVATFSVWTCPLLAQSFDALTTAFGERRNAAVFAIADFDGDGDDDAVMQVDLDGPTRWELHRNDGEGVLTPEAVSQPVFGVRASAVATGDLNGDGAADFVAAIYTAAVGSRVTVFSNNGQGGFQPIVMPLPVDFVTQILPVDTDGDGDLDLVITTSNQHTAPQATLLLRNDGTGSFTDVTATQMPNPAALRSGVAALDVQGDGLVDLVLDGWPLYVLLRQPAGGFVHSPGPFATGMVRIRAVDVDGDGDLDIVGFRTNLLVIERNDGAGAFTTINHPVPGIDGFKLGDIDGDGDQDCLTSSNANDVRLWRTDPGLTLVEVTASQLPALSGSAAAGGFFDSDGDGDQDLWLPAVAHLLHNDGSGRFMSLGGLSALAFDRAVAATDVDGDGHKDLVGLDTMSSASTTALDLAWWRNDGTGRFAHAGVIATVPVCNASKVVAFDMDGDGDDEIWSLQCLTDRVWRNDGGGVLTEVTATTFQLDTRTDVAVLPRDYDGDGDIDVFVARDYLFDSFYINQGNGTFLDEGLIRLTDNELTRAAAALDFDGDGDLDLVLANDPTPLRLFENDGTANFTEVSAAHLPTLTGILSHVLAVDVDGDGDDDLVLVRTASTTLLRNDGGIFVGAPSQQLPSVTNGIWPQAVDFDLDGDLDLLLGSAWLVNDGSGAFTLSPVQAAMPPAARHRPSVFADIDGDGDQDLVAGLLRYNRVRQLTSAVPPRLGFHGEVRIDARSNLPGWSPVALLFFSDRLAPAIPLGPFGHLHLDPANLALLSTLIVPTAPGYAATRYLVPNDTGLLGVTIPLQALIVEGPTTAHTTNAVLLEVRL